MITLIAQLRYITGYGLKALLLAIAVLAGALILAWFAFARPLRNLPRPKAKPKRPPAPLEACAHCGVYRPAGEPCDCDS